jgi:CDP-2,3-bis-(O-geranylgeranyl)-sn-glycerol synthase
MFNALLFVFLFFLPAGIANMAPVFASRVPGLRKWNTPLDGGRAWRGIRLLGDSKTVRGLVAGILSAIAAAVIISFIFQGVYLHTNPILLGALLGLGALAGDSIKSFFKRRLRIAPGKTWFPFDQIDYILGAIAFTCWYIQLHPAQYLLLLGLGFVLHLATVYIGYLTKIREQAI